MRRTLAAVASLAALTACGGSTTTVDSTLPAPPVTSATSTAQVAPAAPSTTRAVAPSTTAGEPGCTEKSDRGPVTVLAASSLVNVLDSGKEGFLRAHPCVTRLNISYGSSATLAAQLVAGSPADVFMSASDTTMGTVAGASLVTSGPFAFARNKAAIMVSRKSAFTVEGLADLRDAANPGIRVGLCVASAPCGSLANTVLRNAVTAGGPADLVRAKVADTETPSVEDLVTKVEMGELDAGIVYASDCVHAVSNSLARCTPIPDDLNAVNRYLVAGLTARRNTTDFLAWVRSSAFAEELINEHGFLAP